MWYCIAVTVVDGDVNIFLIGSSGVWQWGDMRENMSWNDIQGATQFHPDSDC